MERLAHASERLDGPLDDPVALAGNLRDLRRINRFLGGSVLSGRAVDCLAEGIAKPLHILDVGTGSADIPMALLERSHRSPRVARVTALDNRPEVLAAAQLLDPRLAADPRIVLAFGDARSLPYPDRSFDIAHASLLIHHLPPEDAELVLVELGRVARLGVVINDLVRSRWSWLAAWTLAHLLTRNELTRNDAPLSVRRAYTLKEVQSLAKVARLEGVAAFRGPFGHRWALAFRPTGARREGQQ